MTEINLRRQGFVASKELPDMKTMRLCFCEPRGHIEHDYRGRNIQYNYPWISHLRDTVWERELTASVPSAPETRPSRHPNSDQQQWPRPHLFRSRVQQRIAASPSPTIVRGGERGRHPLGSVRGEGPG